MKKTLVSLGFSLIDKISGLLASLDIFVFQLGKESMTSTPSPLPSLELIQPPDNNSNDNTEKTDASGQNGTNTSDPSIGYSEVP